MYKYVCLSDAVAEFLYVYLVEKVRDHRHDDDNELPEQKAMASLLLVVVVDAVVVVVVFVIVFIVVVVDRFVCRADVNFILNSTCILFLFFDILNPCDITHTHERHCIGIRQQKWKHTNRTPQPWLSDLKLDWTCFWWRSHSWALNAKRADVWSDRKKKWKFFFPQMWCCCCWWWSDEKDNMQVYNNNFFFFISTYRLNKSSSSRYIEQYSLEIKRNYIYWYICREWDSEREMQQ